MPKCYRCGCETDSYEYLVYGYDSATGYTDDEIICHDCYRLAKQLKRLDREVESGLHHRRPLPGDPMLFTEAGAKAKEAQKCSSHRP